MNLDHYLSKQFSPAYNCWNFACDVWKDVTGQDISSRIPKHTSVRDLVQDHASRLTPLVEPESPCLVMMQSNRKIPHIGVFVNGSVLHMNEKGAFRQPLSRASIGYHTLNFYR
jgi:hypothetical protein